MRLDLLPKIGTKVLLGLYTRLGTVLDLKYMKLHEFPKGAPKLTANQVITIEPGLYYPEIGACRIEDVVQVTKNGCKKLSSLHYKWEIS